jgi:hypothetical protein
MSGMPISAASSADQRTGRRPGVWVIAKRARLADPDGKMVVTDDRGRYVLPDLPKANYSVWVRGYGLVDRPGCGDARQDARFDRGAGAEPGGGVKYYPAIYWYSMIRIPEQREFPGTGPNGNRINPAMKSQTEFLNTIRTNGCVGCHQLGNKATRTIPRAWAISIPATRPDPAHPVRPIER